MRAASGAMHYRILLIEAEVSTLQLTLKKETRNTREVVIQQGAGSTQGTGVVLSFVPVELLSQVFRLLAPRATLIQPAFHVSP